MVGLALPFYLSWIDQVHGDADVIEVDIESGRIRGKRSLTLYNEKPYYSFRGIPYAQPPIKGLRFKVMCLNPTVSHTHLFYQCLCNMCFCF